MNKFKTISTLATTLTFAAIASTPASAQSLPLPGVTQFFPASMCQPYNSEAAKNLTFFSDKISANLSAAYNSGWSVHCPIPNNSSLSSTVQIRVVGSIRGFIPSCLVNSFKPNSFGEIIDQEFAIPNSTRSILTASSISGASNGYKVLTCYLPSGSRIYNYSIF